MMDTIIWIVVLGALGFLIYRIIRRAGKFIDWVRGSLETDGRASARKISAFVVIFLIIIAHVSWLKRAFISEDFGLLPEILIIDFSFVSVCLGLKTTETIFRSRYGKDKESNTDTTPSS